MILLQACVNESRTGTLIVSNSVAIDMPNNQSNYTNLLKTFPDNRSKLYFRSRYRNELFIIDLNKGEINEIIKYPESGPDAVPGIGGISKIDDTYLISHNDETRFTKINDKFQIIESIDYSINEPDLYTFPVKLWSHTTNDVYKVDEERILIPRRLVNQIGTSKASSEVLLQEPMAFIYNFITLEYETIPTYMPPDYFDDGNAPVSYSMAYNGNEVIYSYLYNDNLYLFDFNRSCRVVDVPRSKFISNFILPNNASNPMEYYMKESGYYNIFYDEERKLYYRIVVFPMSDDEIAKNFDDLYFKKSFSVMVLDKDFNLLTEQKIGNGFNYVPTNIFIGPGGLWISKSNPYNPDYKEGKLEFDVFSFVYQ